MPLLRHILTGGLIALFAVAAAAGPARAETIIFTGSAFGAVEIFETAGTAVQFYGSNNTSPVPVNNNGANFFFHRDTRTGVLSLGLIIDQRNDGTGGRFRGAITGLPAGAFVARSDDGGELRMAGPGTALFDYRFYSCCTDGGVISGLEAGPLSLAIDVATASGLTDTYLAAPSGVISLGVAPGAGLSFAVSTSPEPRAWALFIAGFAGVAVAMKRRRRAILSAGAPVAGDVSPSLAQR